MSRSVFDQMKKSIKEYGQTYEVHRSKFGILDGQKRLEAMIDKNPKIVDHPEIKTIEQHIAWQMAHLPPRLTARDKRHYAPAYGEIYLRAGFPASRIPGIVARLLHCSERHARRYLPDHLKDVKHSSATGQMSSSKTVLIPHPGEFLSFFAGKSIWARIYRKLGEKLFEEFTNTIENHARGIRLDKGKALTNADLSELLEVAYARLEEAEFSGLDEDSIRWWKFLAEEYSKRYSKDASLEE